MNYYITAVLTAKTSINDICYLVLICNSNQGEQCGIRKVIAPSFPYYKYIVDSMMAQGVNVEWIPDSCSPYILSHPIYIGEGNIEMVKIPQLDTLKSNSTQFLDYNSVLSLTINGSSEKSWEYIFSEDYNLEVYSLCLFGNFTYGNISYNINAISNCLQQIRKNFDEKYNNYINAPLYKQSKYTIKTRKCQNDSYKLIVFPEISVQYRVECDSIEEFKWGLAIVQKEGLKGIIDLTGNFILPCLYKDIWPLKLFNQKDEWCDEIESIEYDRHSDNYIHTFVQSQDEQWGEVTINDHCSFRWDVSSVSFKYEKLFYIENKNYAVGLLDRKYADSADSMPLEYLGEDFDFLYRLTLVYYEGGHNDFRMAIDDIINVYNNKYIVAKKNTFNEPKIGLFEIKENKRFYPHINIDILLRMSDDFKAIEYIGSNIFKITFNNIYDAEKYYNELDMCFDYDYDDNMQEYEYMALYHINDGFIMPSNLPNRYIYERVDNYLLPLFTYDKSEDEFVKWWYYNEKSQSWEQWNEDITDCYDDD